MCNFCDMHVVFNKPAHKRKLRKFSFIRNIIKIIYWSIFPNLSFFTSTNGECQFSLAVIIIENLIIFIVMKLQNTEIKNMFFLFNSTFELFGLLQNAYLTIPNLKFINIMEKHNGFSQIVVRFSLWRESEQDQKPFYLCYLRNNYQPLKMRYKIRKPQLP